VLRRGRPKFHDHLDILVLTSEDNGRPSANTACGNTTARVAVLPFTEAGPLASRRQAVTTSYGQCRPPVPDPGNDSLTAETGGITFGQDRARQRGRLMIMALGGAVAHHRHAIVGNGFRCWGWPRQAYERA